MNIETLIFGDLKIEKGKFHYSQYPLGITNIDIDKIVISNKVSFDKNGFKYFVTKIMIKLSYDVQRFQKLVNMLKVLVKLHSSLEAT